MFTKNKEVPTQYNQKYGLLVWGKIDVKIAIVLKLSLPNH